MSVQVFSVKPIDFQVARSRVRGEISTASIVGIQAYSPTNKLAPGTGFILREYPNLVITARHVVMAANKVQITVHTEDGRAESIDTGTANWDLVYYDNNPDADIAVLRLGRKFKSPLELGSLKSEKSVAIEGYGKEPKSAAVSCRNKDWIHLTRTAPSEASGGPVYVNPNGVHRVIGVFVGDSSGEDAQGKAYAIDATPMQACINALK